jgi:hypothetical protein
MDGYDDVFFEIGLVDRDSKRPQQTDLWKVFLCMILDARVYCKGVVQSITKELS